MKLQFDAAVSKETEDVIKSITEQLVMQVIAGKSEALVKELVTTALEPGSGYSRKENFLAQAIRAGIKREVERQIQQWAIDNGDRIRIEVEESIKGYLDPSLFAEMAVAAIKSIKVSVPFVKGSFNDMEDDD